MKATEFKTIAKDAASNQLAQAFAAAKTESEPAFNPQRRAYQGETLLSANRSVSCDTWRSGLNNNVLVLGSSGSGKTRNHVKPNLLQCQGSYIVLDCKGSLYHEMGLTSRKTATSSTASTSTPWTAPSDTTRSTTFAGARADRCSRTSSPSLRPSALLTSMRATPFGRLLRRTTSRPISPTCSRPCPTRRRTCRR